MSDEVITKKEACDIIRKAFSSVTNDLDKTSAVYGLIRGFAGICGCMINSFKSDAQNVDSFHDGEWEMFNLITSALYGKQCYFKDCNGLVYSRKSHETMTFDEAFDEFTNSYVC